MKNGMNSLAYKLFIASVYYEENLENTSVNHML